VTESLYSGPVGLPVGDKFGKVKSRILSNQGGKREPGCYDPFDKKMATRTDWMLGNWIVDLDIPGASAGSRR